jgi:arylsulfatase A-like enzyme
VSHTPINRRSFLRTSALGAAATAVGSTAALRALSQGAAQGARRPNLVFFLADDLGWRDLGCYGSTYFHTPNIDALAARSLRFTQAYTANPLCSPTRASIQTGLYPARIGITTPACHLPEEILEETLQEKAPASNKVLVATSATRLKQEYVTLGETLKAAGYATGHFGKWHLGREPYDPLHQGFDVDFPHWPGPGPAGSYIAPWKFPEDLLKGEPGEHIEDRVSSEVVRFIQAHKDEPFYANYWCFSVHSPWDAKPELVEHYRALRDPNAPQRNPVYAAMIHSMDEGVGRVVKAIDDAGLAGNTIFIFFSDNGGVDWWEPSMKERYGMDDPPTNNAPLRGGKATLYEGGTRVPCMVAWPGVTRAGTETDALISSVDFHPTLLPMLGLEPPAGLKFDGLSFAPVLKGGESQRDTVFCHFPHMCVDKTGPGTWVRRGDWKLIRRYADNDDQTDRFELYNLREDLGETHDLAADKPQKVKELNALIDDFLTDTGTIVPKPNPAYSPGAAALAALGWNVGRDLEVSFDDGTLVLKSSGNDPIIQTRNLPEAKGPYTVEFRMSSDSSGAAQVFWSTGPNVPFHRDRSTVFTPEHDGQWHDYEAKLAVEQPIIALRIDPSAAPGEMRIEWVRLKDGAGQLVKEWRFAK